MKTLDLPKKEYLTIGHNGTNYFGITIENRTGAKPFNLRIDQFKEGNPFNLAQMGSTRLVKESLLATFQDIHGNSQEIYLQGNQLFCLAMPKQFQFVMLFPPRRPIILMVKFSEDFRTVLNWNTYSLFSSEIDSVNHIEGESSCFQVAEFAECTVDIFGNYHVENRLSHYNKPEGVWRFNAHKELVVFHNESSFYCFRGANFSCIHIVNVLKNHGKIRKVSISPNGKYLLVVTQTNILVYETEQWKQMLAYKVNIKIGFRHACWSEDGLTFGVLTKDNKFCTWDFSE